jgi:2-polyprenyl-6-methoxyphenol hydroxylase-like FAD-dependent oxidoreductase
MPPMSPYQPKIAIVGAGPAGLTLGLLLHKHSIPFTIYELRSKPTETELAKPSGMLDLHEESGLAALKACGVFENFLSVTGECAEVMKVTDKDGNVVYADEGTLEYRPEISRHALTKLVLSALPSECVQWGYKLKAAVPPTTQSGPKRTILEFDGCGTAAFDFVVGADGAWSKIRRLVASTMPSYTGVQSITLTITHITEKYPHLADFVGPGSMFALGNRNAIISHRGAMDSARLYVGIQTDDEEFGTTTGFSGQTPAEIQDALLSDKRYFRAWGEVTKELLAKACEDETASNPGSSTDIKPMYMLPIGHTWESSPGVTLIGDAAHLMAPWAGEGVNLAMWDALSLSEALASAFAGGSFADESAFQDVLAPLIKDFEVKMTERAKEAAEITFANEGIMFGDDGAEGMAEQMRSFGPPTEEVM